MYGTGILIKERNKVTKTIYIIQWETYDKTWLGDSYEDEVAAYKAIVVAMALTPIGANYLYGKVIPVTLHSND